MDRLEAIMNKQRELQERLGTDFNNMSDDARADFMRNHRGYLADEVAEALYEMPYYKLWKTYDGMSEEARNIAWQKVRMELVDSLHFFVNLLLCAGFSANELYEMYMAKNAENHRRQDEGYTADVSYRDQAVEDVMMPRCSVNFGGESQSSDRFITVLIDADGLNLVANADTVSLGLVTRLLDNEYTRRLSELSVEEAADIEYEIFELYRTRTEEALVNE